MVIKLSADKKDALNFYKKILNSYNFGEKLNESDKIEIIDLLNNVFMSHVVKDFLSLNFTFKNDLIQIWIGVDGL